VAGGISSVFAEDVGSPSVSSVSQEPSYTPAVLDIRIRPVAWLQSVPGAEFSFQITPRLEVGPTLHYFDKSNTVSSTTLRTFELGLKATYIFWERAHYEGAYISGAFYDYINNLGDSAVQPTYNSGNFSTLGYTITAGYQWDLGIFCSDAWTLRLGGGLGYGQEHFQSVTMQGRRAPISTSVGVLSQLEPTMEITLGFWI
jgi:hypothetical protein